MKGQRHVQETALGKDGEGTSKVCQLINIPEASQMALVERTHLPMQETKEKMGLILGSGRSPGGGHDNPL